MRKIYVRLVIILASVFMANEASAQHHFLVDNPRSDVARVIMKWESTCFGIPIYRTIFACPGTSNSVTVPTSYILTSMDIRENIIVCGIPSAYRSIDNANPCISEVTVGNCGVYTPVSMTFNLYSASPCGGGGGVLVSYATLVYDPNLTYTGRVVLW